MNREDVPAGYLIIAIEIGSEIFCLDCAEAWEGDELTENEIIERYPNGAYCRVCNTLI